MLCYVMLSNTTAPSFMEAEKVTLMEYTCYKE